MCDFRVQQIDCTEARAGATRLRRMPAVYGAGRAQQVCLAMAIVGCRIVRMTVTVGRHDCGCACTFSRLLRHVALN
jgi:hypothetical protein